MYNDFPSGGYRKFQGVVKDPLSWQASAATTWASNLSAPLQGSSPRPQGNPAPATSSGRTVGPPFPPSAVATPRGAALLPGYPLTGPGQRSLSSRSLPPPTPAPSTSGPLPSGRCLLPGTSVLTTCPRSLSPQPLPRPQRPPEETGVRWSLREAVSAGDPQPSPLLDHDPGAGPGQRQGPGLTSLSCVICTCSPCGTCAMWRWPCGIRSKRRHQEASEETHSHRKRATLSEALAPDWLLAIPDH